jgi:hypothetical protein
MINGSTDSVVAIPSCVFAEIFPTFGQVAAIAVHTLPIRLRAHARLASWSFSIELPFLVNAFLVSFQLVVRVPRRQQVLVAFSTFYPVT